MINKPATMATLLLFLLLSAVSQAHPGHVVEAELAWKVDSNSGELQIALAVLPEDLEQALSDPVGRAESPDRLQAYLAQHFRVTAATGGPLPLSLLGLEPAYDRTWVYFSIPTDQHRHLELEMTLLRDLYPNQVNRLRQLSVEGAATLVFAPGDGPKALAYPSPAPLAEPRAKSAF
ncbi:MAG: DUF6702 family protein [Pseudomonadota bacterium]